MAVLKAVTLAGSVLVAVASGPMLLSGIETYPVDGVAGIIGPFVAPEDTVYAAHYTLDRWERVRVGMSRDDGRPHRPTPTSGRRPRA